MAKKVPAKRGRPHVGNPRRHIIGFRLTDEELDALRAARADTALVSLSDRDMARELVVMKLREMKKLK